MNRRVSKEYLGPSFRTYVLQYQMQSLILWKKMLNIVDRYDIFWISSMDLSFFKDTFFIIIIMLVYNNFRV